jgi:integrase/recombinase XerD
MKITTLIQEYLQELKLLNRSRLTIRNSHYGLQQMLRFLESEGVEELEGINRDILAHYQEELVYRLTEKGKQLSSRTRGKYLSSLRGFCKYLYEKDYLAKDLSKTIIFPKQPKSLPKIILDIQDIQKLLAAPDMQSNRGYRNRILLEILYDTGVQAAEMAGIKTNDLDLANGFLHIRSGKGEKDRVVPLSSRVCRLINNYLLIVRPAVITGRDTGYLIPNRWGAKMTTNAVWAVVKRCTQLAGIQKNITTHTFRHSCATHMLKNGAPIRHIQELLGHESLESTQIYTKVTINDLKEIHAKYHPGELFT